MSKRYRLDHPPPAAQAPGRDIGLALRLARQSEPAPAGSVRVYPSAPAAAPVDVPCGEEYHCCTPAVRGVGWYNSESGDFDLLTVVGQVVSF